ncbi:MAG: hypothetical protein P1P86_16605, partial [Bacteroidales bacterium]|nr:hypothetical protein [Bacteroidales bacterium]
DMIEGYSSSTGHYVGDGFAQASVYTVKALKDGYYSIDSTITTEATGATAYSFTMTPLTSAKPTEVPTVSYPGGTGQAWTNDELINWMRVNVPNIFFLVVFLSIFALFLAFGGNNGGGNQRDKYGPGIWGFNRGNVRRRR